MMGKKWLLGVLLLLFYPGPGEADTDLMLSTKEIASSDITLSKSIPCEGDRIKIRAKIHNQGDSAAENVIVRFFNGDPAKGGSQIEKDQLINKITPQGVEKIEVEWTTPKNGIYRIFVVIDSENRIKEKNKDNNKASFDAPVTVKNLHFHYPFCPKSTRYGTVTTCEKKDIGYWKERGVIITKYVMGYSRRSATIEQFVEDWSSAKTEGYDGFMVDEFGDTGEVGERMAAALIKTKEKHPDLFAVVWCAGFGGRTSLEAYQKAADLVLPEAYQTHYSNYKRFDGYWTGAKKYGFSNKAIMGLAFYSGDWRQAWITTEQELLSQIRYLKKLAPEMPGIAFFGRAPDHLYESADKAVFNYYIKPVIWIKSISSDKAAIINVGGMDAEEIKIEFFSKEPERGGEKIGSERIESLKVGEERIIEMAIGAKCLLIVPSDYYTVLD